MSNVLVPGLFACCGERVTSAGCENLKPPVNFYAECPYYNEVEWFWRTARVAKAEGAR